MFEERMTTSLKPCSKEVDECHFIKSDIEDKTHVLKWWKKKIACLSRIIYSWGRIVDRLKIKETPWHHFPIIGCWQKLESSPKLNHVEMNGSL